MGQFSFECVARGVRREKLFQWYFDYSEDDIEIIKKKGDGSLVSRKMRKASDGRVFVENKRLVRGRVLRMVYEARLHPEDYTCDVRITVPDRYESDRHFVFTEVPEGTKVSFRDEYRVMGLRMKLADLLGIVKRQLAGTSRQGMKAYIAEAEEEVGERRTEAKTT